MTARRRGIVVATAVFVVVGAASIPIRGARRSARGSCLSSIVADLDREGTFETVAPGSEWREWTDAELARALTAARGGDCAGDGWRADLGIRTRRSHDGRIETWTWMKSDPSLAMRFTLASR